VRAPRVSCAVAVAALGSLACNDPGFVGPRIVPWQLEADGAPPVVLGSYDRREKTRCRFLHDDQGMLRCLPTAAAYFHSERTFADPTCQTPIYLAAPADAAALRMRAGAVPLPRVACGPQRYGVATLKPAPAASMRFFGTACTPTNSNTAANLAELVIDRTESPVKWAMGTEVDGPLLASGVRVRQVESDEGARFDDHLVDESLGKECHIEITISDGHVCMPSEASSAGYEGTDCTGPPAYGAPACSDPAFIVDSNGTYAIGPKWDGRVSISGHGCEVRVEGFEGPLDYYEKGPATPFTAATIDLGNAGTGRLQPYGVLGDAGVVVLGGEIAPPKWWVAPRYLDSVANRDCDPLWTPEGLVRCIPTTLVDTVDQPNDLGLYLDNACTRVARYCPFMTGSCDGIPVVSATGSATGELHAVALHAAVGQAYAYIKQGDACHVVPGPVFTLGSELPWDSYPEITQLNGGAASAP
jgi:hypothetical protein